MVTESLRSDRKGSTYIKTARRFLRSIPIAGDILVKINNWLTAKSFDTSSRYWEDRYRSGGNSGPGSYGRLAMFKAQVIRDLVESLKIRSVAEFGCGDGNQLTLADYPSYVGYDVSDTVLDQCRRKFGNSPHFDFRNVSAYSGEQYDLSMSLDVIFHLVEDSVFEEYMARLFNAAGRYVLIYASDFDDSGEFGAHVRNRDFKPWIAKNRPDFRLERHIPNAFPFNGDHEQTSFCDFFLYQRT